MRSSVPTQCSKINPPVLAPNAHVAHLYAVDACDVSPILDRTGSLFNMQNLRGNGTGVGCADFGDGRRLAGMQALPQGAGWVLVAPRSMRTAPPRRSANPGYAISRWLAVSMPGSSRPTPTSVVSTVGMEVLSWQGMWARHMGAVNEVVDHAALESVGLEWASAINEKSPQAQRKVKFASACWMTAWWVNKFCR